MSYLTVSSYSYLFITLIATIIYVFILVINSLYFKSKGKTLKEFRKGKWKVIPNIVYIISFVLCITILISIQIYQIMIETSDLATIIKENIIIISIIGCNILLLMLLNNRSNLDDSKIYVILCGIYILLRGFAIFNYLTPDKSKNFKIIYGILNIAIIVICSAIISKIYKKNRKEKDNRDINRLFAILNVLLSVDIIMVLPIIKNENTEIDKMNNILKYKLLENYKRKRIAIVDNTYKSEIIPDKNRSLRKKITNYENLLDYKMYDLITHCYGDDQVKCQRDNKINDMVEIFSEESSVPGLKATL